MGNTWSVARYVFTSLPPITNNETNSELEHAAL